MDKKIYKFYFLIIQTIYSNANGFNHQYLLNILFLHY